MIDCPNCGHTISIKEEDVDSLYPCYISRCRNEAEWSGWLNNGGGMLYHVDVCEEHKHLLGGKVFTSSALN